MQQFLNINQISYKSPFCRVTVPLSLCHGMFTHIEKGFITASFKTPRHMFTKKTHDRHPLHLKGNHDKQS